MPQPILESSPGWARNTSGTTLGVPSPDHFGDFASFAAQFAAPLMMAAQSIPIELRVLKSGNTAAQR